MGAGRFVISLVFVSLVAAATASGKPSGKPSGGPETARAPETQKSQPVPAQSDKAVKTSLEMKVDGVLAIGEGDDRRSSAIIAMKGQGRTYSPGQLIDDNPDLKLVRIQNERIEFLNKGQLEFAPVKRFPDAGSGGGGGGSSSPPAYSASDTPKPAGTAADPARAFRRNRPTKPGTAGQGDAIVPTGPDGQ